MYNIDVNKSLMQLIESWATVENPFNSTEEILSWIEGKNRDVRVRITKVPYDYSGEDWHYDRERGEIRNRTRSFFQIRGLRKTVDDRLVLEQPIIIQDEIGYLGIICKEFDGVLYFLMQAKIEPGNVNKIQISPTIQATKSNFMQAHGGRTPSYLEYFSNKHDYEIIVDQIQSEQSSRFFGKRNRNIIIVVNEEVDVLDTHRWMTLGQIKQLMRYDNLVNMDTRTVISCIPFSLRDYSYKELSHIRTLFGQESFYNSVFFGNSGPDINKIYQYINDIKMLDHSEVELVDLRDLASWEQRDGEICAKGRASFKIVFCDIEIEGREVRRWQQPLLEATGQSVFGLIYCIDDNVQKFLIHTKSEVGCFDKIEVGPSVQLEPMDDPSSSPVDVLFTRNLEDGTGVEFSGLFSEEGGRFFHEQNRNVIMRVERGDLPDPLPDGYFWADFQTLNVLIQFNNCLNIQLRNLLSILSI